MLYSEELQTPRGGGIEVRQESAWAAISNISSACLVALTSLEGIVCLGEMKALSHEFGGIWLSLG